MFGLVGLANMWFIFRQSDYFQQEGLETNPYMHLWSLGVEEQFYLSFPICLASVLASNKTGCVKKLVRYWSPFVMYSVRMHALQHTCILFTSFQGVGAFRRRHRRDHGASKFTCARGQNHP